MNDPSRKEVINGGFESRRESDGSVPVSSSQNVVSTLYQRTNYQKSRFSFFSILLESKSTTDDQIVTEHIDTRRVLFRTIVYRSVCRNATNRRGRVTSVFLVQLPKS